MLKRYSVLILILFLAVGYAGVSVVYKIDGNIQFAYDENNFNVSFSRVSTSFGTTNFNDNTIDFKTISLKEQKEESLLEFEIANKSLEYDAEVNVTCGLKSTSQSLNDYVLITTDIKNPVKITSGNSSIGQVTVQMKKAHTSGITPEISCTMTATPISRTNVGKEYIESYRDPVLNGTDPVLKENLIPVKISLDGTVTYADRTKRWYSYKNKEWANAVILVDKPSKKYDVNDTIAESDIESYFVWIPRFKYLIFNTGNYTSVINSSLPTNSNAQEIQIVFESIDTARSNGTTKGSWLTHPAFTNYGTNGIWVGKFETGYKGATNAAGAEQNINDATKVVIKPNQYSWRGINISNAFKTALAYAASLNSHMMRNTEWGAVAYLSHSKYGINDEVRINNHEAYKTGYAAADGTNQSTYPGEVGSTDNIVQYYNTKTGYKASTTGNITGIYDMSGCGYEYVLGYRANTNNSSGFSTSEASAYQNHFDIYASNTTRVSLNARKLGDATGEIGPVYKVLNYNLNNWYDDYSVFIESTYPWFARGGGNNNGPHAGQFNFGLGNGSASNSLSFRLVFAFNL